DAAEHSMPEVRVVSIKGVDPETVKQAIDAIQGRRGFRGFGPGPGAFSNPNLNPFGGALSPFGGYVNPLGGFGNPLGVGTFGGGLFGPSPSVGPGESALYPSRGLGTPNRWR